MDQQQRKRFATYMVKMARWFAIGSLIASWTWEDTLRHSVVSTCAKQSTTFHWYEQSLVIPNLQVRQICILTLELDEGFLWFRIWSF